MIPVKYQVCIGMYPHRIPSEVVPLVLLLAIFPPRLVIADNVYIPQKKSKRSATTFKSVDTALSRCHDFHARRLAAADSYVLKVKDLHSPSVSSCLTR